MDRGLELLDPMIEHLHRGIAYLIACLWEGRSQLKDRVVEHLDRSVTRLIGHLGESRLDLLDRVVDHLRRLVREALWFELLLNRLDGLTHLGARLLNVARLNLRCVLSGRPRSDGTTTASTVIEASGLV